MKQLRNNIQYEWILLIRNPFLFIPIVLNLLAWGAIIFTHPFEINTSLATVESQFYVLFIWLLILNLFFMGIIAVYIANRDYSNKFEQVALTYPIKNWQWLVSKWVVVQLYGLILTCMTIIISLMWFIYSNIALNDMAHAMMYVFVQMEGALFIMISFGFLFALFIRNIFAYLMIPALLAAALLMPLDSVGDSLKYDRPLLHLFTFLDLLFVESPYEGMWGIDRVFTHTWIHQIAVTAVGFLIICLVIWLFKKERISKQEKKYLLPITLIFASLGVGLFTYQLLDYQQKLKQFITTGQLYMESYDDDVEEERYQWENNYYNEQLDDKAYDFSIDTSDLKLTLKPNHQLEATNLLTVINKGEKPLDEIKLTLNRQLDMGECRTDKLRSCSRNGDFITLQLTEAIGPQDTAEINLSYSGSILRYFYEGKSEGTFIQENRVYLPKSAGWYPLIGHRSLLRAQENEQRYTGFMARSPLLVESSPTKFKVTIQSDDIQVPLALTIPEVSKGTFEGFTTYGLELIGGHLQEQDIDGVRVIHQPLIEKNVAKLVGMYNKIWETTDEWLGTDLQPSTIYVLPRNQYGWLFYTPVNDFYLLEERNDETEYDDILSEIVYSIFTRYDSYAVENDQSLYYDETLFLEMLRWGIYSQIEENIAFMEVTEDDLAHMEPMYLDKMTKMKQLKEKGEAEFKALIQFIYHEWSELENKGEFNLDQLVEKYEEIGI